MVIILTIIKLLIVLSVVATIHEFGHFIFAKLFKMKVDEFSIGFGPAIYSSKPKENQTKFSVRWIPLGGYCAIEGEEGDSSSPNAFNNKAPWQKIIVLIAGVFFNFVLASIIFLSANFFTDTYTSKVKKLDTTGVAYESGIREQDIITKINNKNINIAQDILIYNNTSKDDVLITLMRDGRKLQITAKKAVRTIGFMGVYFDSSKLDDNGNVLTYIETTEPGKPASDAGIKAKDKIIKVNGIDVLNSSDVIKIVSENAGKEITLNIQRGKEILEKKLTPVTYRSFDLGILDYESTKTTLKYSYCKSINTISQIVGSYVDLFSGKVGVKQLSGIVGVGEVVSRTENLMEFLVLLGMISLAIGVANLLPFPPLDGGKVVLVLIECITRKKISPKVEAIISYIGFGLLIALTIYVTINDIIRIV